MKCNLQRHLTQLDTAALVGLALLVAFPASANPNVIKIGPVNSTEFQAIIDAAAPGTRIVAAGGEYDFSPGPVRLTKAVQIIAEDAANPPVLVGRTNPDGSPVLFNEDGTFGRVEDGNNGFVVWGLDSQVRGIEIVGLHFHNFQRAVSLTPNIVPTSNCETTEGQLSGVRIAHSRIFNTWRGIQVYYRTDDFTIEDNEFVQASAEGIRVWGGFDLCLPPLEEAVFRDRPSRGTIARNVLFSAFVGMYLLNPTRLTVRGNSLENGALGIILGDTSPFQSGNPGSIVSNRISNMHSGVIVEMHTLIQRVQVSHNIVEDTNFGIEMLGTADVKQGLISANTTKAALVGILLTAGANGYVVSNNSFAETGSFADVFLEGEGVFLGSFFPAAHHNTVIATDFATRVLDEGHDNRILGTLAMDHHPTASQALRKLRVNPTRDSERLTP